MKEEEARGPNNRPVGLKPTHIVTKCQHVY